MHRKRKLSDLEYQPEASTSRKSGSSEESNTNSSERSVDISSDSSDNNIGNLLPLEEETSAWTDGTLNKLEIHSNTTTQYPAKQIIDLLPFALATEKRLNKCLKDFTDSSPLSYIDVDDIQEIDSSTAFSLMFLRPNTITGIRTRRINEWKPRKMTDEMSGYENWFFNMYYTHGQQFNRQLISMCVQQKSGELQESSFLELFKEFAAMFGLLSVRQRGTSVKIGNTQVNSTADVIFPNLTRSDEEKIKILAVCKAKRTYKQEEMGTSKESRLQSQKKLCPKEEKYKDYLDDCLLGHHGGELFCHLPLTDKGSILGIVLQRTVVTFSLLSCNPEQFKNILEGKPKDRLEIKYSRPYNFLKAEDRPDLIKALLTLGFIQITPNE